MKTAADPLLVLIGDTQRTLAVERLIGREQNDAERTRLFEAAARERPGAYFFLGDMVGWGASRRQWRAFDELAKGILSGGTKSLAMFGNHDYLGGRRSAEANLVRRFPGLRDSKWGIHDERDLRVVYVDSNRDVLNGGEWDAQAEWFRAELAKADADPSVRGVLGFVHHPPYTNSRATGDAKWVEDAFVPPFLASRKALAMVSGHAHGYEKFSKEDRYFFVSGGGGGPRVRLLEGDRRRHVDLYSGPSPRPFHYLRVEARPDGVDLVAIGFAKGETAVEEFDRTFLRFPDR